MSADKPAPKNDIFQGLLVEKAEKARVETTWEAIEKRIRLSAADPKDIEDWVVVVDDSATSLLIIANILKSLCIGVHPFISAEAALEFMSASSEEELKKITAVFSDYEMPTMNGLQFLDAIRATDKLAKLPFVFASDRCERKVLMQIAALGTQGFILKPLTSEAVVDRIMAIKIAPQKRALVGA